MRKDYRDSNMESMVANTIKVKSFRASFRGVPVLKSLFRK
jgi:hypothetical protein